MARTLRVTIDRGSDIPSTAADEPREREDLSSDRPTFEEIATEAYAIYLANGAQHGNDMEHWLEAERRIAETRQRAGQQADADPLQSDRNLQQDGADGGTAADRSRNAQAV